MGWISSNTEFDQSKIVMKRLAKLETFFWLLTTVLGKIQFCWLLLSLLSLNFRIRGKRIFYVSYDLPNLNWFFIRRKERTSFISMRMQLPLAFLCLGGCNLTKIVLLITSFTQKQFLLAKVLNWQ